MIQTFIYSFGASLLTAIWLDATIGYAILVAAAIAAGNVVAWYTPFLIKRLTRRRTCPGCGSRNITEVASGYTGCRDCGALWR